MKLNAEQINRDWANKRLIILDTRLGKGVGAKRERERLNKIINGGAK